jgi:N4-gp56 family major capsid protein
MTTYGNFTQGTAGNANNAVEFSKLYDPIHLMRVTQQMTWDKFAQAKFVPANNGVKTMFAFRYRNLRPATTPLTEGTLPAESNVIREKIDYTIAQYGAYTTYSDVVDLFDVDNVKSQFTDILGDQAALTGDVVIRDIVCAGTNVIYANTATSRALVGSGAQKLTVANFELAVLKLKNARAKKIKGVVDGSVKIGTKPIRSAYVCIVHTNVVPDLRLLTGWTNVENYAFSKDLLEDEVGSLGDIRFIENTNAQEIDQLGVTVYPCILLAEDAYAAVSVRGKKGTEMIFKPLTDGGIANALNQKGSVGWKMWCGAKILNELFLIRLETTATFNVGSLIKYEDNYGTV